MRNKGPFKEELKRRDYKKKNASSRMQQKNGKRKKKADGGLWGVKKKRIGGRGFVARGDLKKTGGDAKTKTSSTNQKGSARRRGNVALGQGKKGEKGQSLQGGQ